jgi:dTDP-4-amino-4,6-dideoxygalactose transaminase
MALTNDANLALRMQLLRSHGITRDQDLFEGPNEGPWYYQQLELGFNYRMTDICAALGLSQMKRLDSFVESRAELAARYDRLLQSTGLILQGQSPKASSAHHLYVVRLPNGKEESHLSVFNALRAAGIGVNLHYIPVYRHPYYRRLRQDWGLFPQSEAYYQSAISLPLYATLTEDAQDTVVATLTTLLRPNV